MTRWTRFSHPAMATLFETVLPDTRGNPGAIAEGLFEEIDRVESLLSRFDPASEISRINRDATKQAVRVERELIRLLSICAEYQQRTGGAFDPAGCVPGKSSSFDQVSLNESDRSVSFARPGLALDLGAVGKGYALLRCREKLEGVGVDNALVHGGTSSVLAVGPGPEGMGWPVGLAKGRGARKVYLRDQALSTSAVESPDRRVSDIRDPLRNTPLGEPLACTVIGGEPHLVEILSTAFLVMGRDRAETYIDENPGEKVRIVW